MHPKLLEIDGFFLPTYGVLVALSFLVALFVVARLGARARLNSEALINLGVYTALSALLGAKLLLIVQEFRYYWKHPSELFSLATLQSGGIFYGGLIVGLAVAFLYMRITGLPGLKTADVFAPGLALGHALGRLGCFSAGCCWGVACNRPWAVTYSDPDAHQLTGVPLGVAVHPTQLYEAGGNLILFGILLFVFRRPHRDGVVLGLYLLLSSFLRFVVEFYRWHDAGLVWGLSPAQWLAVALTVVGLWLLVGRGERGSKAPGAPGD